MRSDWSYINLIHFFWPQRTFKIFLYSVHQLFITKLWIGIQYHLWNRTRLKHLQYWWTYLSRYLLGLQHLHWYTNLSTWEFFRNIPGVFLPRYIYTSQLLMSQITLSSIIADITRYDRKWYDIGTLTGWKTSVKNYCSNNLNLLRNDTPKEANIWYSSTNTPLTKLRWSTASNINLFHA